MAEEKQAFDWADATRGGCLGAVLQWVAIGLGLTIAVGSGDESTIGTVLVWVGIPIFCALLLVHPRTRRTGAAFLIGIAVGSLVGSGLCVGVVGISDGSRFVSSPGRSRTMASSPSTMPGVTRLQAAVVTGRT